MTRGEPSSRLLENASQLKKQRRRHGLRKRNPLRRHFHSMRRIRRFIARRKLSTIATSAHRIESTIRDSVDWETKQTGQEECQTRLSDKPESSVSFGSHEH